MWVAFAMQKLLTFFPAKYINVFAIFQEHSGSVNASKSSVGVYIRMLIFSGSSSNIPAISFWKKGEFQKLHSVKEYF